MIDDGRHHEAIWLQPWCDGCETHCRGGDNGRQWCMDDVWGNKSVRYVIANARPSVYKTTCPRYVICRVPEICSTKSTPCGLDDAAQTAPDA
jgi:hypothetical protein